MASKRMFAREIIESDAFLDLPHSSQILYFHLSMRADDEGFVSNAKSIMRMICCKMDDLTMLKDKGFIIVFESGVIVVRHWKIHNTIQKDRYKSTIFTEEKALLKEDKNKVYSLAETNCIQSVSNMETNCIQSVSNMETQYSIDKSSIDIDKREREEPTARAQHLFFGAYSHVQLTRSEYDELMRDYGKDTAEDYIRRLDERIETKRSKYNNHYAVIKKWIREDSEKKSKNDKSNVAKPTGFTNFNQREYDMNSIERMLVVR